MATKTVAEEKDKPVFDEQTLARLLEAAFVLQEHSRESRQRERNLELQRDQLAERESVPAAVPPPAAQAEAAPAPPRDDYTHTLAQIVETQRQIQARNLKIEEAMSLVAERVAEIARADGAAIAILDSPDAKNIRYRAATGSLTLPMGTEVAMEKALCVACLRTGQVIRCADVNAEFLLDVEECQRRNIHSLIAVPVYYDGGIAGGLELYYLNTHAFTEQDVHTGQLMAGLVTEALTREEEASTKRSLASERAVMLEALEKLRPNLAAMVEGTGSAPAAAASGAVAACRQCGHPMEAREQFCGSCGAPRNRDAAAANEPASSLPPLPELMRNAAAADPAGATDSLSAESLADSLEEAMPDLFSVPELRTEASELASSQALARTEKIPSPPQADAAVNSAEPAPTGEPHSAELAVGERNWTSAAAAREFLEQVAATRRPTGLARFWTARRGDIYLAIAVFVVAIVIRWGIWSSHPVSATGTSGAAASAHRKSDPNADLSLFDRMLISLGLAEAPPTVESQGNPDTQVWVDLHTALYYCPGADLYGKTPKGKYTTQRDAQMDQFNPAAGKACD